MKAVLLLCPAICSVGCGARTGLADDPAIPLEVCNGVDDDGDGAVDEDIAELHCGLGACARTAPGCIAGVPGACEPGAPVPEACNGEDDDCDEAIDDGLAPVLLRGPFTIHAGPFSNATELLETPDGLLAVIALHSIEGESKSQVITRRVGFDGEPSAEPTILEGVDPTQGPTAIASADDLFHLTVCAGTTGDSRLASLLIDAGGRAAGSLIFRDPERSCGAEESASFWTGERHLTGWTENSSAPTFDQEILLDVSDAAARSERGEVLLAAGGDLSAQPAFARAGDRVVMVSGRSTPPDFTRQLQTWVFTTTGERVVGPVLHVTPEDFQPIEPRLVTTGAGDVRLLVPNRFGPGIVTARFDALGELTEPLHFIDGTTGRTAYADVRALPGHGSVIVGTVYSADFSDAGELLVLDDDAAIVARYQHHVDGEGYFAWSSVVARGGFFYVLYSTNLSESVFEERLIVLGCASPV